MEEQEIVHLMLVKMETMEEMEEEGQPEIQDKVWEVLVIKIIMLIFNLSEIMVEMENQIHLVI